MRPCLGHDPYRAVSELNPGDEASCLSLYQPRNPRIVAPEAGFVTDAALLSRTLSPRACRIRQSLAPARRGASMTVAIPAIADQPRSPTFFHSGG